MLLPNPWGTRFFRIKPAADLFYATTVAFVLLTIPPLPASASPLEGSLWMPGIALNIGQPTYDQPETYSSYPGYAVTPGALRNELQHLRSKWAGGDKWASVTVS